MKKACKILCFSLLGIVAVLYLAFLFVLPNVVDLNKFKPDVDTFHGSCRGNLCRTDSQLG